MTYEVMHHTTTSTIRVAKFSTFEEAEAFILKEMAPQKVISLGGARWYLPPKQSYSIVEVVDVGTEPA